MACKKRYNLGMHRWIVNRWLMYRELAQLASHFYLPVRYSSQIAIL